MNEQAKESAQEASGQVGGTTQSNVSQAGKSDISDSQQEHGEWSEDKENRVPTQMDGEHEQYLYECEFWSDGDHGIYSGTDLQEIIDKALQQIYDNPSGL